MLGIAEEFQNSVAKFQQIEAIRVNEEGMKHLGLADDKLFRRDEDGRRKTNQNLFNKISSQFFTNDRQKPHFKVGFFQYVRVLFVGVGDSQVEEVTHHFLDFSLFCHHIKYIFGCFKV